ncbi:hypothetical protein Tco_1300107 [Tanacetum coccineum]
MNEACQDMIAFVHEFESVTGVAVTVKTAAFLKEMMDKMVVGSGIDGDKGAIVKAYGFFWVMYPGERVWSMAALPICDELRRTNNSPDWEPMFILYCRRAMNEDLRFVPEKMAEFMKETQGKDIPNLMKLQILGREFELRAREKDLFIEKLKGSFQSPICFFGSVDCLSKRALFADFPCVMSVSSLFFVASVIVLWLGGGVPVAADVDDGVPSF